MNFTLSDDHLGLRDSAQTFLSKEADLAPLLKPGASIADAGYEALWAKIVPLGWQGMVIPEAYGGLGMSYIDLIMIVGEMGRTLAPSPFFGTLAGAWAIEKAGSEPQKEEWLPKVAAGEIKLALAVLDKAGELGGVQAAKAADGWILSGAKSYVVDARSADMLVVMAEVDGADAFFLVDPSASGVRIDVLDWRDITREVGELSLDAVSAVALSQADARTWPWVRDRIYLLLAAESAAGIEKVLEDAVGYAKERIAFGRPIGAFQAIKHSLAEIAGLSECATAGVQFAAWALTEGDADASKAAAMAQSYASDTYREATHRNIQVFGAIGFTWEMHNHLYYKRARANAELFGSPRDQREEVIGMLEATALAA